MPATSNGHGWPKEWPSAHQPAAPCRVASRMSVVMASLVLSSQLRSSAGQLLVISRRPVIGSAPSLAEAASSRGLAASGSRQVCRQPSAMPCGMASSAHSSLMRPPDEVRITA